MRKRSPAPAVPVPAGGREGASGSGVCGTAKSGLGAARSGQTPLREGGMDLPASLIRNDRQLEDGHPREIDLELLDLTGGAARAEGVLLPHQLTKRAPAVGRPAERELLGPLGGGLDKVQPDAPERLRLVEEQADGLGAGLRGTPPGVSARVE